MPAIKPADGASPVEIPQSNTEKFPFTPKNWFSDRLLLLVTAFFLLVLIFLIGFSSERNINLKKILNPKQEQEKPADTGGFQRIVNSSPAAAQETEDCFKYYPFGKLNFNLDTDRGEYAAGETVNISGFIDNTSETWVADASILVQLHYANVENGRISSQILLNQNEAADDLVLLPNTQLPVSLAYQLPAWLPNGRYSLSFYIISSGQYNLAGLAFVPNTPGDLQILSVKSQNESKLPFFDVAQAQVNNKSYSLNMPAVDLEESPVSIELPFLAFTTKL